MYREKKILEILDTLNLLDIKLCSIGYIYQQWLTQFRFYFLIWRNELLLKHIFRLLASHHNPKFCQNHSDQYNCNAKLPSMDGQWRYWPRYHQWFWNICRLAYKNRDWKEMKKLNSMIIKKEIHIIFDSHLALLFRRPRLFLRLGVWRCFSRLIFLDNYWTICK